MSRAGALPKSAKGISNLPKSKPSMFSPGDKVFIVGGHPWHGNAGTLIAYEKYGLGWMGWRVQLDGNCGECYAKPSEMRKP